MGSYVTSTGSIKIKGCFLCFNGDKEFAALNEIALSFVPLDDIPRFIAKGWHDKLTWHFSHPQSLADSVVALMRKALVP